MTKFTRAQLAKAAGETEHVIGHYIKSGLVPRLPNEGPNRQYTELHLYYLKALRALRSQGLYGDELRKRVAEATEGEIRRLAGAPAPKAAPEVRRALDSVVLAAADAMDVAPKRVRVAIAAAIRQIRAEGVTLDELAAALDADAPARTA